MESTSFLLNPRYVNVLLIQVYLFDDQVHATQSSSTPRCTCWDPSLGIFCGIVKTVFFAEFVCCLVMGFVF
jgi:hypothetical protein